MNQQILSGVALFGGIFLAIQAGFSAHLGDLLKKPILAAVSTYTFGVLFAATFFLLFLKDGFSIQSAKQVPFYLWFTGAFFSVLGITLYYFAIPKLGIAKVISLGLCGQLLFSAVAGHFGWFNLPVDHINLKKIIGCTVMIIGIFLINSK